MSFLPDGINPIVNLTATRVVKVKLIRDFLLKHTMKPFLAVLLLVIGVCVACASRSTSSQTPQKSPAPVAAATQTADAVVSDQLPCTLVMDQAPVLKGLRLGMTPEQVLATFPGSREDAEVLAMLSRPPSKFGESELLIRPDKYETKEKFPGVTQITFTLLDGRVSSFSVGYNGPEWPHVDKFVEKFVQGTNLPAADAWEAYVGMDNQMKTLKCQDFETQIFAGGKGGNLNYVMMRDLIADKTQKERRAKAKQKAKQ